MSTTRDAAVHGKCTTKARFNLSVAPEAPLIVLVLMPTRIITEPATRGVALEFNRCMDNLARELRSPVVGRSVASSRV